MFHSTPESIVDSKSKITYFAICVSPEALNHALLRQPPIIQAYHEVKQQQQQQQQQQQAGTDTVNNNNQQQQKLDIKDEFHCTLQFFSQPKDLSNPDHAAEILNLMSLLGKPVQMTISYVAFTPKIIAARLNIVSPATVAMACSNACPHITIAVGSKAKAVWSNELLCAVEGKVPPHMASGVVSTGSTASSTVTTSSVKAQTSTETSINTSNKTIDQPQVMPERNPTSTATYEDRLENFWKNAKIVSLQNTNMMTIVPGQVCAFCNGGGGGGNRNRPAVSPRLMSPQITPSTSPATTPTRSSKHARSKSEQGTTTRRNNNDGNNKNNINSEEGNQNMNNVNNYTEKNVRSTNPTRNRATESPTSSLPTNGNTNNNNASNNMMMVTSSSSTVGESPMRRESTLPG